MGQLGEGGASHPGSLLGKQWLELPLGLLGVETPQRHPRELSGAQNRERGFWVWRATGPMGRVSCQRRPRTGLGL